MYGPCTGLDFQADAFPTLWLSSHEPSQLLRVLRVLPASTLVK